MGKQERPHIKLRIKTNEKHFDVDYVFKSIFEISEKSVYTPSDKNVINFAGIAKEFVVQTAKMGEEGLLIVQGQELQKKYKITNDQYYFILRRLKQAGIIRKSLGKFYIIKEFYEHLGEMSAAMNRFYMNLGVKIE